MPANTSPIFTGVCRCEAVSFTTANTNRDGTGTIGDAFVPGANGSAVENVRIKAIGTTTAGMVRLYVYDGATYRLIAEVAVTAITPSGTVQSFQADWTPPNGLLPLPSGRKLGVSTHNGEQFIATTQGGDF